jgi:uncharacterized protein
MPMVESSAFRQGVAKARFYRAAAIRRKWRTALALHPDPVSNQNMFTGHGAGYVAINGRPFRQPVVVMAGQVRTDWPATEFAMLEVRHFEYFLELKPEVLLFGTGAEQQFARPDLYKMLIKARIGIEFMNTPAACRTYNILVAEDRHVIAAVLL